MATGEKSAMETVMVLSAQDHLPRDRCGHQSRVMQGMFNRLGGVPRSRRKVKSPPQVFPATSMRSESARYAVESRNGMTYPMNMALGIPRNQTPVLNGVTPARVLRTRSDGDLLNGFGKGIEAEKTFERKKNERKVPEKMLEKGAEKPSDRREGGAERRMAENKKAALISSTQADQTSNVQKKVGVIRILQRPPTKEAAAENIALFNGRAGEGEGGQISVQGRSFSEVPRPNVSSFKLGAPGEGRHISLQGRSFSEVHRTDVISFKLEAAGECGQFLVKRRSFPEDPRANVSSFKMNAAGEGGQILVQGRSFSEVPRVDLSSFKLDAAGEGGQISAQGRDGRGGGQISAQGRDCRGEDGQISVEGREVRPNGSSVKLAFLASSPPKDVERWAGPAFMNSPPPCDLPLSTFVMKREALLGPATVKSPLTAAALAQGGPQDSNSVTKSSSAPASPTQLASPTQVATSAPSTQTPVVDPVSVTKSSSAPTSPTQVATLFFSAPAMQSPLVDPVSATKDLRRMLSLDDDVASIFHRMANKEILRDKAPEQILSDSATENLKRILNIC